jgi:bifunctional DNase/RNase
MVEVELTKIVIRETSNQQYIFLREKVGQLRQFPIVIGLFEAEAINRRVREIATPRPMTHDLLANLIASLGGKLQKVVVNQLKNNTFFARLLIEQDGVLHEVDSRPSDAIALAVHESCPIFVAEEVLDEVAIQPQ